MDLFDPANAIQTIRDLWALAGPLGPVMTVAFTTVFLVKLARKQLTGWIPWLATRRGALALVGIFAAVGTAVTAALQGETSAMAILGQALSAALTAVGLRSSTKAAVTGGAALIGGWDEDGKYVVVMKHEHATAPKDFHDEIVEAGVPRPDIEER